MRFAPDHTKTCRSCRWFQKGECTCDDAPFQPVSTEVEVEPFFEGGILDEAMKEGFPQLDTKSIRYTDYADCHNLLEVLGEIPNLPTKWKKAVVAAVKKDYENNKAPIIEALSEQIIGALCNFDFEVSVENENDFSEFGCHWWE